MHFTLLLLVLFAAFCNAKAQWPSDTTTAYISIRQTLNFYALAIDSKNFTLLSQVFTSDAVADLGPPFGIVNGMVEIEATIRAGLVAVMTQHALSTQMIDITSASTASSVTYLTASHFGIGPYAGQVVYAYGKYVDKLVCYGGKDGWGSQCQWLVDYRVLEYMGPLTGNLSIFTYQG